MGTWGPGNFDDDAAADHLSTITAKLVAEIEAAFARPGGIEPGEYGSVVVPCNVELLALIAEQRWVGSGVPDAEVVEGWKQRYLAVWDQKIDALAPSASYAARRRPVLVATFDRLLARCERDEPARTKPPAKARAGSRPRAARANAIAKRALKPKKQTRFK